MPLASQLLWCLAEDVRTKISITLPIDQRDAVLDRLDDVRSISHNFGYGVGDEMDILLAEYKNDA